MIRSVVLLTTIALWLTLFARAAAGRDHSWWALGFVALGAGMQTWAAWLFWRHAKSRQR